MLKFNVLEPICFRFGGMAYLKYPVKTWSSLRRTALQINYSIYTQTDFCGGSLLTAIG